MKTIPLIVSGLLVAACGGLTSAGLSAADLALEGSGYYSLGNRDSYYRYGTSQSGRFTNLGSGYYRSAEIGMEEVANYSYTRSGSLSFEIWALSYYGASSGTVLMSRQLSPLWDEESYYDVSAYGRARSLNSYRYPELNLYEYTRYGWRWRDAFSFSYRSLL